MHIAERLLVCLAICAAFALPIRAQESSNQGQQVSVPLSAVLKAGRDTPDLLRQIDVELRRNDLRPGDIACGAAPGVGGGQGAPYQCRFGDRTLRVEADRTLFDVRGKRLGRPGEMPDEALSARAKSFRENNLRWSWAPEFPR